MGERAVHLAGVHLPQHRRGERIRRVVAPHELARDGVVDVFQHEALAPRDVRVANLFETTKRVVQ